MDTIILLKGLLIGFILTLPIGPVSVLCLRYNLLRGRLAGIIAGLGSSAADLIYSGLAIFGIAFIIDPITHHQNYFRIGAALFLGYLGFHLIYITKQPEPALAPRHNWYLNFFSTFFLTLSNPTMILLFISLFALLGLENITNTSYTGIALMSMIFIGANLGWLILAIVVHQFRKKIDLSLVTTINKIAGIGLLIFGTVILVSTLCKMI